MDTYRDFLVGLFMLVSGGVVLGLLLLTSNPLEQRQDLYMRASTADGLQRDTRVFLQGLQVGRVTQVVPRVDAGELFFVAHLSLLMKYPDGTPLEVPEGTTATIAEPSPIADAVIRLEPPDQIGPETLFLQPGDTIVSTRLPSALDLLANLSTELKDEVLKTLQESRSMMAQSTRTLLRTSSVISSTQEALATTTPKIDEALDLLAASLARTDSILADLGPRIGPLQDSLLATLGQARLLMGTLDTLATDASIMLEENRSLVSEALLNLMNTTRVLDNFAIQVTQRPLRLLTGVKPPAADTGGARR